MKGTQRERTVVRKAAHTLCELLRERDVVVSAHYWIECPVAPSSNKCRGRADAVVAALMKDGTVYTISIEAKSMRTRHHTRGEVGCVAQGLLATVVSAGIATGGVWYFSRGLVIMLALAVAVVVWYVVFKTLWNRRAFFNPASVINQLLRYPGNELWIALPKDAIRWSSESFEGLLIDCKAKGIGVIEISRRGAVQIHLHAKRDRSVGQKLREYLRGDEMLRQLTALAPGGATAAMPDEQ